MIGSFWSASGTSRVSLVASQVIRGNEKPKIEGDNKMTGRKRRKRQRVVNKNFTER